MKRPPRNWLALAVVVLSVSAAFFAGAYIATKFVSPCVCVFAQARTIN